MHSQLSLIETLLPTVTENLFWHLPLLQNHSIISRLQQDDTRLQVDIDSSQFV